MKRIALILSVVLLADLCPAAFSTIDQGDVHRLVHGEPRTDGSDGD